MDAGKIYLRDGEGLVPFAETSYAAEELLQTLLASYPDLLAGDQMRPSEPRRWLLVAREAGIPDADAGQARWSLDHLFIDQEAIPTLVEVKRSSDTRIRREVVGQMLDYAANIVAYWPAGQLRHLFEDISTNIGINPDQAVLDLLGAAYPTEDEAARVVDEFWERAASNLASRSIRLVFVADVIPPELQRIIEFLNENLVRAEVLAVEVRQYVGQGRQMLVPRVVGRTSAAEDLKKASGTSTKVVRTWEESEFLAAAAEAGHDALALVRAGLQWMRERGFTASIGKGKFGPLYFQAVDAAGTPVRIANVNTHGQVMVQYDYLVKFPPFDQVSVRVELNNKLNKIPGVNLAERSAVEAKWPGIQLAALTSPAAQHQFFAVLDWVAQLLTEGGR